MVTWLFEDKQINYTSHEQYFRTLRDFLSVLIFWVGHVNKYYLNSLAMLVSELVVVFYQLGKSYLLT